MTIPYERTRAVQNAEKLLLELFDYYNDEVIKSLRGEDDLLRRIKGCLRHYPTKFDLTESCKKCPDIWGMP